MVRPNCPPGMSKLLPKRSLLQQTGMLAMEISRHPINLLWNPLFRKDQLNKIMNLPKEIKRVAMAVWATMEQMVPSMVFEVPGILLRPQSVPPTLAAVSPTPNAKIPLDKMRIS